MAIIKNPGKEMAPGAVSSQEKVEPWWYDTNLVFKDGEGTNMDLLSEDRLLIHTGKLLLKLEGRFGWNRWVEVLAFLVDSHLVLAKPQEKDGVTKYELYRRPIRLDLLTLGPFPNPPTQRRGILWSLWKNKTEVQEHVFSSPAAGGAVNNVGVVYPFTVHRANRLGGPYALFAESAQARSEWRAKLEGAIGLRKAVQESNKVLEMKTLSVDTFFVPTPLGSGGESPWNLDDENFTGNVTCSVPFDTPDGRALVAIGCADGVRVGFRNDSRSMLRVQHLRMVTQCAMLEEFGIFLSLFAYHIEALVPPSPGAADAPHTPQKLSGNKDVQFFTSGDLAGRTLVIYMKKKDRNSIFRVLEPVIGKTKERAGAQPSTTSRFGLQSHRPEWFRVYRDFFLPHTDAYDLLFPKARIVILCNKGFEIMDLSDFKSVTIPQHDDPGLKGLAKRIKSCRPMGMFRSGSDEFLLCYDEFGLSVDKHGGPSRIGTVEWEGKADRVTCHPPYILLFDQRFIEIRHVETGCLVQIISGNDVRCTWDGRGANQSQPISEGSSDDVVSRQPRVHGVMNMEALLHGKRAVTTQHVFELVPIVPLPLPGPSVLPSFTPHLYQLDSPAHPAPQF
ncbi:CNH domain-containing protein [Thelephora terrestris]|uniref:CNH domain-containing protein n=1 Tax=Thelephora terrestris TaxID=56493 RepID=A0A9P6HG69_9AGAM|nr:CNH domain-containing protein [Thelephora terrestris]